MSPKITIIIPIYNVEPYLRQCLDSVVGQTLQALQVICVDHTSTDGSLAILKEFATKDARIQIIHCENTGGGVGQARNAALSHVKGKYTYFADSDDWLDLTLCEKVYYRLEQSSADVMFFYPHLVAESGQEDRKNYFAHKNQHSIQPNMSDYLDFQVVPWNRVIRTAYLESIAIRFPEGKLSEDLFFHWASLVHEPEVILLPQKLYYHRLRAGSAMGKRGELVSNMVFAYTMLKQYLLDIGKYKQYKEKVLSGKFNCAAGTYNGVQSCYKDKVKQNFLETIDDDEIAFLKAGKNISGMARCFCLSLLGSKHVTFFQKIRYSVMFYLKKINRTVMRPLENLVRFIQGRSKKGTRTIETAADRQIRELSELVCQLSKENVELREELQNQSSSNVIRKRIA